MLTFQDARAAKETILKMDEVLLEIKEEDKTFKPPIEFPWEILL